MNARQLAEVVHGIVNDRDGDGIADVLWDGSFTTAPDWFSTVTNYENRLRYIANANASVPVIEALINQMLGDITDPSVGGTRQHTESVNNFALPVGEYVGFVVDGFRADGQVPELLMLVPMRRSELQVSLTEDGVNE